MSQEGGGGRVPLDHTRQVTIDALCEHFANDVLTVEEFEARVDTAHRAATLDELRELLADLPTGNLPVASTPGGHPAPLSAARVAPRGHQKETSYAVAVMGGARRTGQWAPARTTHTIAIMGGVELDFREALLPPGVTEVRIYALMGGVEVIVPPDLSVESHGIGILGGFEHSGNEPLRTDPEAPVLRISGVAVMGGVDVKVRLPGESARDARQRRRVERRAERHRQIRGRAKEWTDDLDHRSGE